MHCKLTVRVGFDDCLVLIGLIPKTWCRYTIPAGMTVIQWITDFSERVKQLQNVTQAGGAHALKNLHVWLGGLFIPEAYITASRQYVAQANNWSLEELYLDVCVYNEPQQAKLDDCSFGVTGTSFLLLSSTVFVRLFYPSSTSWYVFPTPHIYILVRLSNSSYLPFWYVFPTPHICHFGTPVTRC